MAEHPTARAIVELFLERQRAMYSGGESGPVAELLAEDVVWHVPGMSPIAGEHRGREAALRYFDQRRALAGGALTITKLAELSGADVLVQLADGQATLGGRPATWRTAGVYRVADGKVAEAWLIPLEAEDFDRAWCATRSDPFVYRQRVRPQDCAASTLLGHPRFLEFFEAAFLEWWRARLGAPLADSLGGERRLTLAGIQVDYRAPVCLDEELCVEVSLDRHSARSLQLHYEAHVERRLAGQGSSRYVCLDSGSGRPAPFPEGVLSRLAAQRGPS